MIDGNKGMSHGSVWAPGRIVCLHPNLYKVGGVGNCAKTGYKLAS